MTAIGNHLLGVLTVWVAHFDGSVSVWVASDLDTETLLLGQTVRYLLASSLVVTLSKVIKGGLFASAPLRLQ